MRRFNLLLAASFLTLASAAGAQTVINFDNLSDGSVVTTQYAGVEFSSSTGFTNYVTAQNQYNASKPNFICSGPIGRGINCSSPTIVTFLSAVTNVSLKGMGINDVGNMKVAQVDLYNGATFLGSQDILGNGQGFDPLFIDLMSWGTITRLELNNITDVAGIGWDDFAYTAGNMSAVPEPASVVLLVTGLAGIVVVRRRRS